MLRTVCCEVDALKPHDGKKRPISIYDATFLLSEWSQAPVVLEVTDETYSLKLRPEENWVWFAFRSFARVADSRPGLIKTFASIGCGVGIDAIGAAKIFPGLRHIVVADIDRDTVELACRNVRRNISESIRVDCLVGDVCYPLVDKDLAADVIYANLPTLPVPGGLGCAVDHRSFYDASKDENVPKIIAAYFLSLQVDLLLSARRVLTNDGCIILMLGGRFPKEALVELGAFTGFQFEELVSCLKPQSEVELALSTYSALEGDVEFDFYIYNQVSERLANSTGAADSDLKELLRPYRVSATEAYSAYRMGHNIGHILYALKATSKR
jgi:SAM-dependent methyltransferase